MKHLRLPKFHMSATSLFLWTLVVVAAALVLLLALLPKEPPPEAEDTTESTLVRTQPVKPRDLVQTIALPGRVLPQRIIPLAAEISGAITAIHADKGDTIRQGDIILRIDERTWDARHRQAVVEQADAARNLERWTRMQAEGAVSKSEYDAVARRKELADIALDLARIQLDKARLVAPVDGIIEDRPVEPGGFINEGQVAFRMIQPKPLKVLFHVPERDIAMLTKNKRLTLRIPALEDAQVLARVTFIGQETAPPAFSYPVELEVMDPPAALRPGMIIEVELERAVLEQAIAIPLQAVIPRRGEDIVYRYQDGSAVRTVVRIDAFLNGEAVIADGLSSNDLLIVEGHRTLQDGTPVELAAPQE